MRVRSADSDLLIISAYFPTKPKNAKGKPAHLAVVRKVAGWIDKLLDSAGKSCTPIVGVDLNDGIGIEKSDDR